MLPQRLGRLTQAAIVDVDAEVNGAREPKILSSRTDSRVGEEECHSSLLLSAQNH